MNTIKYKKNEIIHSYENETNNLELIISGKVEVKRQNITLNMKKGCIIGLFEHAASNYTFEYKALEDTTLISYPYTRGSDVNEIINQHFDMCDQIVTSIAGLTLSASSKYFYVKKNSDIFINTIKNSYASYKKLCETFNLEIQSFPFLDNFNTFIPEKDIPEWVNDYYDQLEIMPQNIKADFYSTHPSLATATVLEAANHMKMYLNQCQDITKYTEELIEHYFSGIGGDIFSLYKNLQLTGIDTPNYSLLNDQIIDNIETFVSDLGKNPLISMEMLNDKLSFFTFSEVSKNDEDQINSNIYSELSDSLNKILNFTHLDDAENERFRYLINKYKQINDKTNSNDEVKQLRLEISKYFFDIYETAAINSMELSEIPVILKMFFYFGYMDENLVGLDNAIKLYNMAVSISSTENVYTAYDWLKSIYNGHNEPSINEFDQEYHTYLKAQRQQGYITLEMEKRYLNSPIEKVRFEINNFFKNALRMASGYPSTFCPLLSGHNIIRPLEQILVSASAISQNWDKIRSIDYSCFYRECSYHVPEKHIVRANILTEVLPITILMPIIGIRGGLWQETSGAARNTSARMFMPIFSNADNYNIQIMLAGHFRWNICKKIQGSRWNDILEHSLTSEYFDYLQFYKRNNELSSDAKEKIRTTLFNNKNNFKNIFLADYYIWIKHESQGTPRLNKVARQILFEHCPFASDIRNTLIKHPLYQNLIIKHTNNSEKKYRSLQNHFNSISQKYKEELPEEIQKYIDYYKL